MKNSSILVREQPSQTSPFQPVLDSFGSPMIMGCFALVVVLLLLQAFSGRKTVLSDARFASHREIKQGNKKGLTQIAKGEIASSALQLEDITISDVQPAIAVVGKSGMGKTRYVIDPSLRSAIDQGWTNLVFDIKGDLIRKHAPYALAKGYKVYIYAPGFPYSDGLNFLEFMKDKDDAKTAEEIAKVMEANFGVPGERKDGFFSPQAVAALRLVFMMAKSTCYPDLVTAWKFLSLPNLAKRLRTAHKYEYFESSDLGVWVKEASTALRSMADSGKTVQGILGTSMTNFQRIIDPSIVPCLTNHTIPLDLRGKQIVFFQLDEQATSATAPLVAAAINMLLIRNLNAEVKRDNPLGLFLDEFDSISLPNIKDYITKMRSYGLIALLAYQSDAQVYHRYTRDYAVSILSSCTTKMYFNPGHLETAERVSKSLGQKEAKYNLNSRSRGGRGATRNTSEQLKLIPLIAANKINQMATAEVIIIDNPGFSNRPYKKKFRINKRNNVLWRKTLPDIWFEKIKPCREKKIQKLMSEEIDKTIEDREIVAEANMPSEQEIEELQHIGN